MKRRGAFIVFEGCDRCGKSTQSAMLVDFLKRNYIPTKHMAFPNRQTPVGKLINEYLTHQNDMPDESIHLLFAINRWEAQNKIEQYLNEGTTIIVDRYSYSGAAYGFAKGKIVHLVN